MSVFLILFLSLINISVSSYQSQDCRGFGLQFVSSLFLTCVSHFLLHWKFGNCINNHINTLQLFFFFATFLLVVKQEQC